MKFNLRTILYVMAFAVAFILWTKWQMANQPVIDQQQTVETAGETLPGAAPAAGASVSVAPPAPAAGGQTAGVAPATGVAGTKAGHINVHTDLLDLVIDLQGGTISRASLLDYPVSLRNRQPLALMHESNPNRFILQSGLTSQQDAAQVPGPGAIFSAEKQRYVLADGEDTLTVPLQWTNEQGVTVRKVFVFTRGKYEFSLHQEVDNQSDSVWQGYAYQQLVFGQPVSSGGLGHVSVFTGGVMSTADDPYNKINLKDFAQNLELTTDTGWVAMIQHYFLGALIPEQKVNSNFYTRAADNDNHTLGVTSPAQTLQPGAQGSFDIKAYIGPKIQSRLQAVAPALDKTVDYGFLFMIAQPMFYVLSFIHGILGNWGWAIVVMTLLIKMLFFVPSAWAYKSMAKMRRLQPQMARLKERYGDDRQAMSQAMMALYRKEKVNPASGCLPMLLQIPFFIAFYWVLVESVELRQAPWIWWIHDLSERDPYFILPVINAALMFIQQKLNPPPPDPMQAKIMMMLPLVFGFMFMWFPSGLVLYWSVSNAFSIVQQYVMNKRYGDPKSKPVHDKA